MLVRQLGAGGMGDVWLATDTRAERPVALKFIKPHLLADSNFRTRFLNEAKTLGRLEHDRIVTLYNVVESDGYLALVLRFIDGRSLADHIDAQGALPTEFVLACARDVLPALGFAHERGTVHRDIKSQNVLVDGQGRAFLTDFGIAVGALAQRHTVAGFALGTPHYMSPEQIQTPSALAAENGGHRSDIYSFGVVLFEMLTGRLPFGGDSKPDETFLVQHAHCTELPPPLRSINPRVTPAIESVVLRCLAKNPGDRPQSCAELLKDFESAALSGAAPVGSKARAATVVEAAPPAVAVESAPSPRIPVVPARQRRPTSKVAWLGLGALVMISAIGLAVWNQPEPSAAQSEETPVTPVQTPDSTGRGNAAAPMLRPQPDAATQAADRAVALPPPRVDTQSPRPAVDPAATESFRRARALAQDGRWCEAQAAINDAVKRNPSDPAYRELKEEIDVGCTAANQLQ
jgi:serine/threonine-protein kinase